MIGSRHIAKSGNLTLYYGFVPFKNEYYFFIIDDARVKGSKVLRFRKTSNGLTNIELAETLRLFSADIKHISMVLMNQPI